MIITLGLISAGLVYKFVINKPHTDYEKAKPAYIISAADLYDSFISDRTASEEKYNGQVILLNGRLDKVEISGELVTGIFIFEQGVFGDEGIRCSVLPKYVSNIKAIPQGSMVQLKGFLTGYNDSDIILEQCSVIQ